MKELIVFGTKNMALEIKEIAENFYSHEFSNVKTVYFSENFLEENNLDSSAQYSYIVGFGGTMRKSCLDTLKKYENFKAITIIHPSAVIAKSAKIGEGCLVMPNATVSTNAQVGHHSVLNYNASVGHDAILEGNNFVQPGARVSGNCKIGEGTLIGSNSFVYQNLNIGKECLIDALTYVHEDVSDRMILSPRYNKAISRDDLEKNKLPMWE